MPWVLAFHVVAAVRAGHGAGAADAHDAGFPCGLSTGWRQLMLMMLAFGAGFPHGSGS